jgi:hypothetical protein
LFDDCADFDGIPRYDSIVQHTQATERVDLVAELPAPHSAFLAEAQELGQIV